MIRNFIGFLSFWNLSDLFLMIRMKSWMWRGATTDVIYQHDSRPSLLVPHCFVFCVWLSLLLEVGTLVPGAPLSRFLCLSLFITFTYLFILCMPAPHPTPPSCGGQRTAFGSWFPASSPPCGRWDGTQAVRLDYRYLSTSEARDQLRLLIFDLCI